MHGFDLNAPARILILEDSALDAELIMQQLKTLSPPPAIRCASNRAGFMEALEGGGTDVILADFSLPDFDGMTALELARQRLPETPFIFVSGVLGEEAAIESFRHGATDYVLKQRLIRLPAAVERALAEAREKAERRRGEQHRELLVRELSHRVKNTMAMVMSIVRRTAGSADTVESYIETLMGRLRAMADAHALLFETNWNEAGLRDVIERAFAAHPGCLDRVTIVPGPQTPLDPRAALSLSMVLNELATNALRHGALSDDRGEIEVAWQRETDGGGRPRLVLTWRERGGPAVSAPAAERFGTTLIRRTIAYELMGSATLDFAEDGLACTIRFPLQSASAEALGPSAADLSGTRRG